MKKALYLLLISSPMFAMQPDRVITNKLQEKLPKRDMVNVAQKTFGAVHLLNQSVCTTILPFPPTIPMSLLVGITVIGIDTLINMRLQKQDNNK